MVALDLSNFEYICWNAGVIGIGITATAVGLLACGIDAALARKNLTFTGYIYIYFFLKCSGFVQCLIS